MRYEKPLSYEYPHKLDLLGQTAIDFGIDFVMEHNRRVDEREQAMSELIEWRVVKELENGVWHNASDGAQSMFGLTTAKKLAQRLGPPWQVKHRTTMLGPEEHEATPQEQTFGAPWAP